MEEGVTVAVEPLVSSTDLPLPLFKPFISEEALEAASRVMRSGHVSEGEMVRRFEAELANWTSCRHILTLNSGTSAIHLALHLAGVVAGDEVISTPMTCAATNTPIVAAGARIVWADIDPTTGNLSLESVKQAITAKTKAIICVDWSGYPCDLDELQQLADVHHIALIEDAAHGFGSCYKGSLVGGIADFTCLSFQAIKHMTTIDGGALICKSEEAYRRGKLLRWFGIEKKESGCDYRTGQDVVECGYKFHMNDVTAAIGSAQLVHMGALLARHRDNAEYYREHLAPLAPHGLTLLAHRPDRVGSYWMYSFLVPDKEDFIRVMQSCGITCSSVHTRNDDYTAFRDYKTALPGVDLFSRYQVSIPVGWWIDSARRERIVTAITNYFTQLTIGGNSCVSS